MTTERITGLARTRRPPFRFNGKSKKRRKENTMMLRRLDGLTSPVNQLYSEIDRAFPELWRAVANLQPFRFGGFRTIPAMNVWETDENLFVEIEVPGMSRENLEVAVAGNELTVRGSRMTEQTSEEKKGEVCFHRRERSTGEFSRVLHLPVEVDADKVQATLRDGVLTITLPKAASVMPRKIKVTS
jgi:HSP20 family protein